MTAIATARRVGGSIVWPISLRVSSTWTTSLRMLALMVLFLVSGCVRGLAQAVPLADVLGAQAADAIMHAVAGAHRENEDDLVGRRRTGHADLDGVELATHVAGVA